MFGCVRSAALYGGTQHGKREMSLERKIENYRVTIRGTRPILQHRWVEVGREELPRRGKVVRDTPAVEAERSLYRNANGELFQPSSHIEGAMTKAAIDFRMEGKGRRSYRDAVKAAIVVEPLEIVHKNQKWVVDTRMAVIHAARGAHVNVSRGRLDEWELDFTIMNMDPSTISESTAREVLAAAGQFNGIGDYRPKFGLFDVTSFVKVNGGTT